jgi:hypothetical protein
MNNRHFKMSRTWLCGSALITIVSLMPNEGLAGIISTVQLMTELMMEDEGENMAIVGELFGPDKSSPLSFSSNVDITAMAFSFSLDPGSTYQGLAMTLSGSAVFDPVADIWNASSSGTLGSVAWTPSGTYSVTGDPFELSSGLTGIDNPQFHDYHDLIFYNPKTGESGGTFHFTDIHGERSTPNFPVGDTLGPDGKWHYEIVTDTFRVDSGGSSPVPGGGAGSFTTTISPVPEPSGVILLCTALGLLGVVRAACWRLHA